MAALLSEPVAATLVALDEADGATLTEIAQASGRALSTIQRAVDGLLTAKVVVRTAPRGEFRYADGAPRRALRQLAEWSLGDRATERITSWVRRNDEATGFHRPPATVRDPRVRGAWPAAIDRIVTAYQPLRVILFGSQARGDSRRDSDVDLVVVFEGEIDRSERRVALTRLLTDMPFAKDVLVARADDMLHPLRGSALAEAVREGVTVYER